MNAINLIKKSKISNKKYASFNTPVPEYGQAFPCCSEWKDRNFIPVEKESSVKTPAKLPARNGFIQNFFRNLFQRIRQSFAAGIQIIRCEASPARN